MAFRLLHFLDLNGLDEAGSKGGTTQRLFRASQDNEKQVVSVCVCVAQSCPTLCDPWTVALQASLSVGFSRQEYCSGVPFPSPEDLPDPGIEPRSPA